mmetsp:Transcript_105243/g.302634  ORF Transcript_105243/g.302634 Transcript_105243/m.302634 type:complete len:207 (+) Transcript_105243:1681-2301(+)
MLYSYGTKLPCPSKTWPPYPLATHWPVSPSSKGFHQRRHLSQSSQLCSGSDWQLHWQPSFRSLFIMKQDSDSSPASVQSSNSKKPTWCAVSTTLNSTALPATYVAFTSPTLLYDCGVPAALPQMPCWYFEWPSLKLCTDPGPPPTAPLSFRFRATGCVMRPWPCATPNVAAVSRSAFSAWAPTARTIAAVNGPDGESKESLWQGLT